MGVVGNRKQQIISLMGLNLVIYILIRKKKHYREANREELNNKARKRYEENRDDLLQKTKDYISNNHDKVLQQKKEYRERSKEQIREKAKEHYEANKTKILLNQKCYRNQKIMCPACRCEIDKYNKQHEKTNKHIRNIEKLNESQKTTKPLSKGLTITREAPEA